MLIHECAISIDYDRAQWLYDMGMHETLKMCDPMWYHTCMLSDPSEQYFRKIHGRLKINEYTNKSLR